MLRELLTHSLHCFEFVELTLSYFNQLKIQKACQLLDFTDMKVNQVCFKVGIEDNFYFSRLFRKIMGMSPLAYKQMKKG